MVFTETVSFGERAARRTAAAVAAAAFVAVAAAAPAAAAGFATPSAADREAIGEVIRKFDDAIQNLDSEGMEALFYDGKVVWLATGHPESRAFIAERTGETPPFVENEGFYQLFGMAREQGLTAKEHFGPPTVLTDGQLATVAFDYHAEINGQISNWGFENWQMVKTPDGWKIVHLMYSYNLQPVKPKPLD